MKKIILCIFILLVSVNVFASEVDIEQLTEKANSGDDNAQYDLGDAYAFGNGVPRDFKQAAYWYQRAAEQGHVEAQFNLGLYYAGGMGVAPDFIKAVKWLNSAAKQGHLEAHTFLGVLYFFGDGVEQDYKQAYVWFSLGLAQVIDPDDAEAIRYSLEKIKLNMTPAEIAEAQQMAEEWMEKHR